VGGAQPNLLGYAEQAGAAGGLGRRARKTGLQEAWKTGSECGLAPSQESVCAGYDCAFVWLTKELGVPLVIPDKTVLQTFTQVALSMIASGALAP
jgi:hypothetical protein